MKNPAKQTNQSGPYIRERTGAGTEDLCSYISSSGIPLKQKMELVASTFEISMKEVQQVYARAAEIFVTYSGSTNRSKWLWVCSQFTNAR